MKERKQQQKKKIKRDLFSKINNALKDGPNFNFILYYIFQTD